jgi:hypothetical protein
MRVQTFIGKGNTEGLHQLDTHINDWLRRTKVTPAHVLQSLGVERYVEGRNQEPIVVVSVWYKEKEVEDTFLP